VKRYQVIVTVFVAPLLEDGRIDSEKVMEDRADFVLPTYVTAPAAAAAAAQPVAHMIGSMVYMVQVEAAGPKEAPDEQPEQ